MTLVSSSNTTILQLGLHQGSLSFQSQLTLSYQDHTRPPDKCCLGIPTDLCCSFCLREEFKKALYLLSQSIKDIFFMEMHHSSVKSKNSLPWRS